MSMQDKSGFESITQQSLERTEFQYQTHDMLSSLMVPDEDFGEVSEGSATICQLSDSGLECRVCGVNDGKTTSSTWGVMLCMLILLGMAAFQKRHSKNRSNGAETHCFAQGAESDLGDDEKALS